MSMKFPGNIPFASDRDSVYSNCQLIRFQTLEECNDAFKDGGQYSGHMMPWLEPQADGSIYCMVTEQLGADEKAVLRDRFDIINELLKERTDKRREAERKDKEEQDARLRETVRLGQIGKEFEERMAKAKGLDKGEQRSNLVAQLKSGQDPDMVAFAEKQIKALGLEINPELVKVASDAMTQAVMEYLNQKAALEDANPEVENAAP